MNTTAKKQKELLRSLFYLLRNLEFWSSPPLKYGKYGKIRKIIRKNTENYCEKYTEYYGKYGELRKIRRITEKYGELRKIRRITENTDNTEKY